MMTIDLTNRRALVTGGGQGLGRGIALGLSGAGAEVIVNDVRGDRALAVAAEISGQGGKASSASFDITDYEAVAEAVNDFGSVDILVNNAGNAGSSGRVGLAKFVDTQPRDWEPYLRVNLYGVMNCSRAVLPGMIERGWGRIVTIVSDAGRAGGANTAAYSAAKAGAAGLTRSVALEAGRFGVTANNIALGTMRMAEPEVPDEDNPRLQAVLKNYVVRRPGRPDDVVPLVVLLASEQASWITGQTYPVNGGFSFAL